MVTVSLLKAQSYDRPALTAALERVLDPLGGMAAFVKPGDRVLLKPNWLTGARPTKECTTHPEIIYGVAQMVQAVGGQPFVGDSPAFGSAQGVARANGCWERLQALQVPIVEFQGQRYQTVSDDFNHLRLSREAMGADVVINLPKVKSHLQLTLTLGVKNLFGCVPGKMKAWWHLEAGKDRDRFGQMLVETARAINPALTIMDGIVGHEGNGPSHGEPRPLEVLAAATDVFALDRVLVDLLRVNPSTVPTLVASRRLGLCPDWEGIQFPLLSPEAWEITDWQLPETLMPIDFGLPRILRSTLKHVFIRWVREPLVLAGER